MRINFGFKLSLPVSNNTFGSLNRRVRLDPSVSVAVSICRVRLNAVHNGLFVTACRPAGAEG